MAAHKTFFPDDEPASRRGGLLAPLVGLIAAVALFVSTLSVIARTQDIAAETHAPIPSTQVALSGAS